LNSHFVLHSDFTCPRLDSWKDFSQRHGHRSTTILVSQSLELVSLELMVSKTDLLTSQTTE